MLRVLLELHRLTCRDPEVTCLKSDPRLITYADLCELAEVPFLTQCRAVPDRSRSVALRLQPAAAQLAGGPG